MAGSAITEEAARRGHRVLAVSRHPREDGSTPRRIPSRRRRRHCLSSRSSE
nr:hypothetical protein [Buchananella hordeovulneris]